MNRALVAGAALATMLISASASASDPDPWFGPDKAVHFGVSVALSAGGYAASSLWLDTRGERALAGGAFSLTLGAAKELWDLSGQGDPSWRDFTWDAIGTGVGLALAVAGDALLSPKQFLCRPDHHDGARVARPQTTSLSMNPRPTRRADARPQPT